MRISDWSADVCSSDLIEYREPSENGIPGRLVGACLTDRQGDGLSMSYSFFDPHHDTRPSLGNYIIMDHILRAARAGLPYVYLGYWVEGSKRMQYKIRYRPLERLSKNGWVRFDPDEQQKAIRERSEEHTSELQSLMRTSYAVFCLKKKK